MCTFMALYRGHPDYWLAAAANRDERLDRPSAPPGVIRECPRVVGGLDLISGGTWLGLNEHGLFVVITNRHRAPSDPTKRSRGLLVLDALGLATPAAVARMAMADGPAHNPFNLVALSREEGVVITCEGGAPWQRPLPPGALVLTAGDPNDTRIPNIARGLRVLDEVRHAPEPELVRRLAQACADHRQEDPEYPPFCGHGPVFGTVSSTILLLSEVGPGSRYLFAPGPPCGVPYGDCSALLSDQ